MVGVCVHQTNKCGRLEIKTAQHIEINAPIQIYDIHGALFNFEWFRDAFVQNGIIDMKSSTLFTVEWQSDDYKRVHHDTYTANNTNKELIDFIIKQQECLFSDKDECGLSPQEMAEYFSLNLVNFFVDDLCDNVNNNNEKQNQNRIWFKRSRIFYMIYEDCTAHLWVAFCAFEFFHLNFIDSTALSA